MLEILAYISQKAPSGFLSTHMHKYFKALCYIAWVSDQNRSGGWGERENDSNGHKSIRKLWTPEKSCEVGSL